MTTRLSPRLRVLALLTKNSPITARSPEELIRTQRARLPRNALTGYLFGRLAADTITSTATAPGPDGPVPVHVYRPASAAGRALPIVLYIHGGGFVLGDAEADWLCSRIAHDVDAVVISVDYRLAPGHRAPSAAEDSYAALLFAAAHADAGADPTRIAVIGDSAGGNIAASVALLARDRSGPAIASQVLVYPFTDLTCDFLVEPERRPILVVGNAEVRAAAAHYLGTQDARDPIASPFHASDHTDLPPALIQVAQWCPLTPDGNAYADRLRAAGVSVRLTEYAGMPHGFLSFPNLCTSATPAVAEITEYLRESLHPGRLQRKETESAT